MSSSQRQIINTVTDDLEEITQLKFKIDMNLLFKGSDRSKVNMNYILKFRLSLTVFKVWHGKHKPANLY